MTPAAKLQRYLKRKVTEAGGQYRKLRWESRRGAPDCLVWFRFPNLMLVEVKAGDDALSELQQREILRLRNDGWPVCIARSEDDIDWVVAEMKGKN